MLFKNIVGQHEIKKKLIQTVKEDRISHAQLFLGPDGSGTLPLAIAYAQYISCLDKKEDDACGKCTSCIKYERLIHPDLHFIYPVVKIKSAPKDPVSSDFLENWRLFVAQTPYANLAQWFEYVGAENKQGSIYRNESYEIIKKLNLKTFEAEYKIMIIWMPEAMNSFAANKLLKIIEEPPPNTVFLLVSRNADLLLPTIRSRTQIIKIPKIDKDSIAGVLEKQHGLDEKKRWKIAHLADGNFQKANELLDSGDLEQQQFEQFKKMMRLCYAAKIPEILKWTEEVAKWGREKQKSFLLFCLRLLRDNFMFNIDQRKLAPMTEEEEEFSSKFSSYINQNNIYQISEEVNKAHLHIGMNAYNKLVFMDLCIKMIKLLRQNHNTG